MKLFRRGFVFATLLGSVAFGCKGETAKSTTGEETSPKQTVVKLNGAGATFPYPLYSKWMSVYGKQTPTTRLNYQSIGSGGGIRQVIAGTVDFGATDAPMKPSEEKKAPSKLLHVPTTLGAVAVAYNLKGVPELKLDPAAIVGIFDGSIKNWNDAKIQALNEGAKLPDVKIAPVFRSDGSGTTAVFSDYLAKVNPAWKENVGVGKSLKWPAGLGAKGNEGVTGQIKTTPGAVGYIELAYATRNKLPIAGLKNASGEYITPTIAAITAAASGVDLPESLTVSITNSPGKGAYPIAAYTYLLVFAEMKDKSKGQALANFLWWATHEGQVHAKPLHYAPLPEKVVRQVEARIKSLKAGGAASYAGDVQVKH